MGGAGNHNLGTELLERIAEISALCERIEQAEELPGDSVKALKASVRELKRDLLQYYLEYRSAEAARVSSVPG